MKKAATAKKSGSAGKTGASSKTVKTGKAAKSKTAASPKKSGAAKKSAPAAAKSPEKKARAGKATAAGKKSPAIKAAPSVKTAAPAKAAVTKKPAAKVNVTASSPENTALVSAMLSGISEVKDLVPVIGERFMESARALRFEQGEALFRGLSESLRNLGYLIEFIKELKKGIPHLKTPDISVSALTPWDKSLDIFRGMLSAFEVKDWVTLSDLIQYELQPLLAEGAKGLAELEKAFSGSGNKP